ncbi:MAG TPA: hypothetical protein VMT85_16090 [Thermoanaerobaculia bacterium]|nr:hypothetical protein [Thermoanaerobaculia bacterium]
MARTATDLDAAGAALPALVERLRQRYPDAVDDEQAFRLVPLREHTSRDLRPTLLLLPARSRSFS